MVDVWKIRFYKLLYYKPTMRSGKGNHFAAGLSMRLGHHCKKQRRRRFTQLVLTCFGSARATKMTGAIPLIQPSNRCFITRQPHVPTNSYTCLETSSPHVSTCFFLNEMTSCYIYIYTPESLYLQDEKPGYLIHQQNTIKNHLSHLMKYWLLGWKRFPNTSGFVHILW